MINLNHDKNLSGKDFFVGDLHGCYSDLMSKLDDIAFDRTHDRLFAVGDLIDRGRQSIECLRLINEPWFFSVLGNHEIMLLDVLQSDAETLKVARPLHVNHGGEWALCLSKDELQECHRLINSLPVSRTVHTRDKSIGIIHAGWRWDWFELVSSGSLTPEQKEYATSSRLDNPKALPHIGGIDVVVAGHQNIATIECRGNQIWIDTVGKTTALTLIDISSALDLACSSKSNYCTQSNGISCPSS
jgi:serine/threonine protein phosphatase 1